MFWESIIKTMGVLNIKKVIYHDHGGAHTSVVASGIHIGILEPDETPTKEQLMEIPFFDKTSKSDFGKIKYMGKGKEGNEIYTLGTKNMDMGILLTNLVDLQGISDQFVFYNTMPYVNNSLRLGGWLSRGMSLPAIGRPLVISGLKKEYARIGTFVKSICSNLGGANNEILISR